MGKNINSSRHESMDVESSEQPGLAGVNEDVMPAAPNGQAGEERFVSIKHVSFLF